MGDVKRDKCHKVDGHMSKKEYLLPAVMQVVMKVS